MPVSKIKVGVLRGGPSSEYEVSLKSGAEILANLRQDKYEPRDVFISKSGVWHDRGIEKSPERVIGTVDVVINGMHGEYGEDGQVQKTLEAHRVPFTGSGSLSCAMAMNKVLTKREAGVLGIKMPRHLRIKIGENIDLLKSRVVESFAPPYIVKPVSRGSSVGVAVAQTIFDIEPALYEAFLYDSQVVVEEYISGREATCGIVEDLRNQRHYCLPPVEILPPDSSNFFDYNAKYGGGSREICPGNFSDREKQEMRAIASRVHDALGLRHYSRSDFIVTRDGIYFLEVNSLPGITKESLFPKSLEAIGVGLPDFLDHIIGLAMRGR